MPKVVSIKKIASNVPQKCITVSNPDGLFVLKNGLVTHNSSEYIMRLYGDSRGRVWSRMKDNYYGRTILDSSPNTLDNAIDDYIVNEARKDPKNYIVEGSVWKWAPEDYKKEFEEHSTFYVYTGGKGNPPKLLEKDDPMLQGDTADRQNIIEVPKSMEQLFKDDLVKAIKDQAGIPAGSANTLIYDYKPLEAMFNNELRNIYTNINASSKEAPEHLIWNQVCDTFFKNRAGRYEYYYKPNVPRCLAVDQSYATDVTGIAVVHVERFEQTGELIYVVDFTIPIVPLKDGGVNLEAIRCFVQDLTVLGNLRIEHVGFDQFQSETTIQNLERAGYDVEKVSTDKTMDPYMNLVSLINRGRIACGKNIFLKNNIKSLHVAKTKGGKSKIDHDNSRAGVVSGDSTWNKGVLGMYAKDVSDAVGDAIELCRKYFLTSEETWDGGPHAEDSLEENERIKAQERVSDFLAGLGLGL